MSKNHLQTAINELGLQPLAKRLGVTYQAIRKWKTHGIPAERVIPLCRVLDFKITPHQLRPDLYPNPDDGISVDERKAA